MVEILKNINIFSIYFFLIDYEKKKKFAKEKKKINIYVCVYLRYNKA